MTFTRYELDFPTAPNSKTAAGGIEGAIVEHKGGLGCLQPWTSLGDGPLESHIGALRRGAPTEMGRACLLSCAADAAAKRAGRSLLDGLKIPTSHHLWGGGELEMDVEVIKVKTPDLVAKAPPQVRIRLDLNASMEAVEFERWANALDASVRDRIDFVEDPVPYEAATWESLATATDLSFALDRGPADATRGFAVRVWKPACVPEPPAGEVFCITHNMDHEIGRQWAKYRAATFEGELVECGLV